MRFFRCFLIYAGASVGLSVCSTAATLTSYISQEGKAIIVLNGEIAAGDAGQLEQLIKAANDAGKAVSGIRLNSPGGNLGEGAKLADAVRFAKIATVVPNGSTCASACFLIFAAGADKYASYSASVGVHGASENGQETTSSNAATVAMAKMVKELGVPADIIGRMVVTPPDQMVWLPPNSLRAMGTTMTGKPVQTQASPPATQTIGPSAQTSPSLTGKQAELPQWGNVVDAAANLSSQQNGGKPRFVRACQPELKTCFMAITFKNNAGKETMIKTVEDIDGKIITREVCEFNAFGDVRTCTNWDNSQVHRDMKDVNGNWNEVADH